MSPRQERDGPAVLRGGARQDLSRGLLEKNGNHLTFTGTQLGSGRERSRETIAQNAELQTTLRQAILASGPVRPGRRSEHDA